MPIAHQPVKLRPEGSQILTCCLHALHRTKPYRAGGQEDVLGLQVLVHNAHALQVRHGRRNVQQREAQRLQMLTEALQAPDAVAPAAEVP